MSREWLLLYDEIYGKNVFHHNVRHHNNMCKLLWLRRDFVLVWTHILFIAGFLVTAKYLENGSTFV